MTGSNGTRNTTRGLLLLSVALGFGSLSALARTPDPRDAYKGPGRYEIEIVASGKALALDLRDQHTVRQWSPDHKTNQQWDLEDAGGGYVYIRSAETGMALDTEGGYARDGAPVIVSQPGGGDGQLWRIQEVDDGHVTIISRVGLSLDLPNSSHDNGIAMQVWKPWSHNNQKFRLIWVSGPVPRPFGDRYEGRDRDVRDGRDEKSSYDLGYSLGIQDFRAQLRRSYARHKGEYNPQGEEAFIEGYYDGYDAGRTDNSWMRPAEKGSYDEGYRLGLQDQREGRKPNYMHYADRFDASSEPQFRKGYADGYYSTPQR